jgi:hypothetical protein
MKHILTQIFVTLGVIFLICIVVGAYFFVSDPLNLKPLIFGTTVSVQREAKNPPATTGSLTGTVTETSAEGTRERVQTEGGFTLSPAQKQALVAFGIDPATVPSSMSLEQETCFVGVLGEARVGEIKAGAVPSAIEFFKAKGCI